jgi:PIN domain nuclease of toxin-antitoxin system
MILLDTHTLVWWQEHSRRLSDTARRAIEHELRDGQITVSAFSCWEIAIAVAAVQLPGNMHKDPSDRIIVATARWLGAPLISADLQLQAYQHVTTIW